MIPLSQTLLLGSYPPAKSGMALAFWGRHSKLDQTIRAVFLVLFALMSALFAAHFTLALS